MNRALRWLLLLPVTALLAWAVGFGTGEALHARLLLLGQSTWPGYAELRIEPLAPNCSAATPPIAVDSSSADEGDDFLDDLLGEGDVAPIDAKALRAAALRCAQQQSEYQSRQARRTSGLLAFLAIETATARFVQWGIASLRGVLVLLLVLCAGVASLRRAHIALRPAASCEQDRVSQSGQLLAHALLLGSFYSQWQLTRASEIVSQDAALPVLWMLGFAGLATLNLRRLYAPSELPSRPGSALQGLLSVPLYAWMCTISGVYFLVAERYPAGLAITLQQLTEHAQLYLHVALYVWIGMLLKRTQITTLSFNVVRSLRLPTELFAFVVVSAAAIPTAYSGASGIFVIAAGAVVFRELSAAGARPRLALASTALSGSLGVVLSPCLLVVVIASLNKQVTTEQLYGWGWKVYALTSGLFLIALLALKPRSPAGITGEHSEPEAPRLPALATALLGLLPSLLIAGAVLAVYFVALDVRLGEHTAPVVLPVVLCALIAHQARKPRKAQPQAPLLRTVLAASDETSQHIGALLTLMALSICLGGAVVRGDLMGVVPESFGSAWLTMSVLLVVLVCIGMLMDPYGAVILVSAALADIAYRNGIDPVQFWMVVLVAFELGYLTPPVALNHLLTRHVVGPLNLPSPKPGDPPLSFYARHEDKLLPLFVMGTALLLVAYVPLFFAQ